jgi:pimeloyl-ACP methyl ester carboxylesterase
MIGIKKETGTVKSFDGTEIYYEVLGEGKPIVMAYGIVCVMNHWHFQSAYFSNNYRVIMIDYRGHHKSASPKNVAEMNVPAIAKDLLAVCDHLKLDSMSILSHSFGAQVVLEFYSLVGERIKNMVLINGFHKNPIQGMFGMDMVPVINKIIGFQESLPETFNFLWLSALENPLALPFMGLTGGYNLQLTHLNDVQIYLRGVKAVPVDVFLTLFKNMMDYDATSILSTITCPTLIIAGNKDNVTPMAFQKEMHHKIKNSELQIIPYGSHCSQLDMPDFVNLKIEAFLNQNNY